jgi:uncharacterized repeat protein (TIGR01451 family)
LDEQYRALRNSFTGAHPIVMKRFSTLYFLLASAGVLAQNCSVQLLDTLTSGNASVGQALPLPDGGFVIPYGTDYPEGDLVISRFDADGYLMWENRKMTVNPSVLLWAGEMRRTQDGGLLVFGGRTNLSTTTENSHIIRMDSTGHTEWARIYMRGCTDVEETADGGLLIAAYDDQQPKVIKTDPQGVPVWGASEGITATQMEVLSLANGDQLVVTTSDDSVTVMRRIDQSGVTVWSTALEEFSLASYWPAAIELSNGNLLISHRTNWPSTTTLTLLDANGTSLNSVLLDILVGQVFQLASGSVFAIGYDLAQSTLIELSLALVPISAWIPSGDWALNSHLHTYDDTLRLMLQNEFVHQLAVVKASPPYDLSCAMMAISAPVATPLTVTPVSAGSWWPDTLRNWAMALVEIDPNACDVSVGASCGTPRPGFLCGHYFVAQNQGGSTTSPLTVTAMLDANFTVQNAIPVPTSIIGNTVTWTGTAALAGLASSAFQVWGTLPPDTALLGQAVTTTFNVQQDTLETSLVNNTFTLTRVVTGAYDPNDKLVFPKDFYHIANDSILDYTIRFQNTGTDTAFNIVVIDTLPPDVDVLTFQPGAASHPYTYSLTGEGLLKFSFSNILLPDSNTNEPLSHGLVSFRIKPMQPVYLGQTITNVADIYFDFNPPVRTPPATVVVTNLTGFKPAPAPELRVFPVPVNDLLTVELPASFHPRNAIITAADGRTVWTSGITGARERLNVPVQQLALGAYQITLLSMSGERLSARFVKE